MAPAQGTPSGIPPYPKLEQRDVPQDVQHLLQQVQLRAAGDRPGHSPPLPLLRQNGQSKVQVPLGRRQAPGQTVIMDVNHLESKHACSL
jgi:hypothetical protein